ncbi:hypothetical protein GZH82_06815 [Staphylococcus ursi]|uniref:hypothetical protein n=1 Tax=Staphylococcus sp. MI 10-1553 TaxID=1912064 RepID=UPI00139937D7|nr:hypothetical protein [Staphylococcus sp. MI 10-1553]QHW37055.1 hypothetical protein GZH82_06815 [Staphylococcus sp. MI 10-1553]
MKLSNIVDKYKGDCPYLMEAYNKNLIDYFIIDLFNVETKNQRNYIINVISFYTDILIKRIYHSNCDKFLVSTVIRFNNIQIEEAVYSQAIHFNKVLYKKAPLVYGKVYSKKFNIFMVIIRPYLGKIDNKFFRNHPDVKEGKITNLSFKNVKTLLKYDKNRSIDGNHDKSGV